MAGRCSKESLSVVRGVCFPLAETCTSIASEGDVEIRRVWSYHGGCAGTKRCKNRNLYCGGRIDFDKSDQMVGFLFLRTYRIFYSHNLTKAVRSRSRSLLCFALLFSPRVFALHYALQNSTLATMSLTEAKYEATRKERPFKSIISGLGYPSITKRKAQVVHAHAFPVTTASPGSCCSSSPCCVDDSTPLHCVDDSTPLSSAAYSLRSSSGTSRIRKSPSLLLLIFPRH